jgi:hypothetical protein
MFRNIRPTPALVAVVSMSALFVATAASASATTTWDTNKGTGTPAWNGAFTATAGPGTLSGPSGGISCTSATATGTLQSNHHSGAAWPTVVNPGTITFTSCKIGGTSYNTHCTYDLDATSYSAGVTEGDVTVDCTMKLATTPICTITGSIPSTYTNATDVIDIPSNVGGLTIHSAAMACPMGSGTGSLTSLPFTVTSAVKPDIIYTP